MMAHAERQRIRRKAWTGPRLLFMSALSTALLVFPIFLGNSKTSSKDSDNGRIKSKDMRHRIFMISGMEGRTPTEKEELKNIYAWIDLKSPGRTMSPDTRLGFREFTCKPPRFAFTTSDAPFIVPVPQDARQSAFPQPPPMILGEEMAVLTKPINDIVPWTPFWEVTMPEIEKPEKPMGIFWRGEDGRLIANPPVINERIARESWNKHEPSGVTTIECSQFMGRMPPRVIIRRSCGNSELDLLAADALRNHLLGMSELSMIENVSFRPFRTDVLWHLRN